MTTPQHQTAQNQTAPHQTAPHQTAPHQTAPLQTAPHQTAPHQTAPHQTAPHQTAPHQTAPLQQMKADLFKAMGNPIRIRVLELLCERERSVGEMIVELGVGASALSQQLGVLRGSGLVRARREASVVHYSVTTPRVAELLTVGRQLRADLLALQMEMLTDLRAEDDAEADAAASVDAADADAANDADAAASVDAADADAANDADADAASPSHPARQDA